MSPMGILRIKVVLFAGWLVGEVGGGGGWLVGYFLP